MCARLLRFDPIKISVNIHKESILVYTIRAATIPLDMTCNFLLKIWYKFIINFLN
jgi:hypothetical protein